MLPRAFAVWVSCLVHLSQLLVQLANLLVLLGLPLGDGGGGLRPGQPQVAVGLQGCQLVTLAQRHWFHWGRSPGPCCNHSCHPWAEGVETLEAAEGPETACEGCGEDGITPLFSFC